MEDPAGHRRLFEVFDAVADLAPEEQPHAVGTLCSDDPTLAREVLDLLGHDRSPAHPLTGTEGLLPMAAELLTDVQIPKSLGPYRVLRKLGAGGMGVVFEGEQDVPRRRVALKVVHPWLRSTRSDELLRQEVQSMAEVVHSGIPQVYQVFSVDEATVVAMELIEGPSLGEAWPHMDWGTRLRVLSQVADAVAAAHRVGVVHRDLKPGNLKLLPGGQPKVLDFGIASRRDHSATVGAGTAAYAAPEQLHGNVTDARADVFALGVTMAELVLGRPPRRDANGGVVLPATLPASPALQAIIRQCVQADPERRYRSMAELCQDLEAARNRRPVRAMGFVPLRWTGDWIARHRVPFAVMVTLAVVATLVGVGVVSVRAMWFHAWQTERARVILEEIRSQPLDTAEARSAAMAAFTRDAALSDTPYVSEGWSYIAERATTIPERRLALARAWSTARTPNQTEHAALALAEVLADEGHWDAVRVLRDSLRPGSAPDVDLVLAIEDGDLEAAAQSMDVHQRRLLPLLSSVVIDQVGEADFRPLLHRDARWVVRDPGVATRVHPDGSTEAPITVPGGPGEVARRVANLLVREQLGMPRRPPEVEQHTFLYFIGDADGDGIEEAYALGEFDRLPLSVSEPVQAEPVAVLPALQADSNGARAFDLVDLDADGRQEALIQFNGWAYSGIAVVEGLPDRPRVIDYVRARQAKAVGIRTTDGPAFAVVGLDPDKPFRVPGEVVVSSLHRGRLIEGRIRLSAAEAHIRGRIRAVFAGDVDGDGLDEVLVDGGRASWIYTPSRSGWSRVALPDMRILAVGDVDGDGRDEVWVRRDDVSMLLGADGGGPLPARERPTRTMMAAAPAAADARLRAQWTRAEQLASLGLVSEAVSLMQDLAQVPGPLREPALRRALVWLQSVDTGADFPGELIHRRGLLAEQLASSGGWGQAGPASELRAALVRAHRIDALVDRGWMPDPGPWTPIVDGHQIHPSASLDPLAVRVRPRRDDVEVRLIGRTGDGAIALPIEQAGPVVQVRGVVSLDDQDFSHQWGLHFKLGERAVGMDVGRFGGGPADNHGLGMSCAGRRDTTVRRWQAGDYAVEVSLDLARGTVRCRLGKHEIIANDALDPDVQPTSVQVGTRSRYRSIGLGQSRLRVHRLGVRGARVAERAPDLAYRAIHGDLQATQRLLSGSPEERVLGAYLARDPGALDLDAVDQDTRARLLRLDAATWGPAIRQTRGDDAFAEDFVAAFDHPMQRMNEELRQVFDALDLSTLPLDSPASWRVHRAQAQADIERGRLLQAEQALSRLSTSPQSSGSEIGEVWLHLARRALAEGDGPAAAEALREALDRTTEPLRVVTAIWRDPELAPLSPIPPGPRTGGAAAVPR